MAQPAPMVNLPRPPLHCTSYICNGKKLYENTNNGKLLR